MKKTYSIIIKALFIVFILSFLAPMNIYSQASTTLGVYARVLRVMTVNTVGANKLNFGNISVTSSSQNFSIANHQGQKFEATGSPNYVIYADWPQTVTLNNYAWVISNGGINGTMTFSPNDIIQHSGDNSGWSNPYDVTRNTYNYSNLYFRDTDNDGVGKIYFWLGGSLTVPGNQPIGNYEGTLTFTVSY